MKKTTLILVVLLLSGCNLLKVSRTVQLIENPATRSDLLAIPEIRQMLEENDLSLERTKKEFCRMDPVARILFRIEFTDLILKETTALGRPIDLSEVICET